jgi:hypothetical protein
METLNTDTLRWATKVGINPDRLAFLLACPKYTRTGRNDRPAYIKAENPNHHLQKLGDCYWFRLRRRGKDIVENIATDLETARKRRDEMLAAFDAGKPIPYINIR